MGIRLEPHDMGKATILERKMVAHSSLDWQSLLIFVKQYVSYRLTFIKYYFKIIKVWIKHMNDGKIPQWAQGLSEEDWQFVKRFILASGSLKQVATDYGITYPTLRLRLDRLITKVHALDTPELKTPFHKTVKILVAEGKLDVVDARALLKAFDKSHPSEKE